MVQPQLDFADSTGTFDWAAYVSNRPPYTKPLYDVIFGYHKQNSNEWHHAYDMGTGIGIVAAQLATRFESVTASDPSANHISNATSYMSTNFKKQNVKFVQCKAEDASRLDADSVDMVTMGQAIHFTEYPLTMAAAARVLRPGGTFAALCYDMAPRVVPGTNPELAEIQRLMHELFDTFGRVMSSKNDPKAAVKLFSGMIDLSLDPKDWTNVRRVNWKRQRQYGPWTTDFISKCRVACYLQPWESFEEHDEACMIVRDVDYDWLVAYYNSMYPGLLIQEICSAETAALKEKMQQDTRIDLVWSSSLVLATKR